jgi:hypothetical protein
MLLLVGVLDICGSHGQSAKAATRACTSPQGGRAAGYRELGVHIDIPRRKRLPHVQVQREAAGHACGALWPHTRRSPRFETQNEFAFQKKKRRWKVSFPAKEN